MQLKNISEKVSEARRAGVLKNESEAMKKIGEVHDKAMKHVHEVDKEKHHELQMEQHEALYGAHYDDTTAECCVSQMRSKDAQGYTQEGELFSIAEAKKIYDTKKAMLTAGTTAHDIYVAVNCEMHKHAARAYSKLGPNATIEEKEKVKQDIIDEAMHEFFFSSDAKIGGKIWNYEKMFGLKK